MCHGAWLRAEGREGGLPSLPVPPRAPGHSCAALWYPGGCSGADVPHGPRGRPPGTHPTSGPDEVTFLALILLRVLISVEPTAPGPSQNPILGDTLWNGWGSVQGTVVDGVTSGDTCRWGGAGGWSRALRGGRRPRGVCGPPRDGLQRCGTRCTPAAERGPGTTYLLLQAPVMSRYLSARQVFGHAGGSM